MAKVEVDVIFQADFENYFFLTDKKEEEDR